VVPASRPSAPEASFPRGFLWGAATAAHQVEGGNARSDWWHWEQLPGRINNGDRSGLACDHYLRYRDDFALLADLGHSAHRLSLEWSRLEPAPGLFDADAIAHYRDVLLALREHGLEPFVTLHHFTNPDWLANAGGWLRCEVVEAFARFVKRMVAEYRDLVRYWITVNEPTVYAFLGYVVGKRPPGYRNLGAAFSVLRQFVRAHARAYWSIKAASPDAQVGIAHHRFQLDPLRFRHPLDRLVTYLQLWLIDELYPAAIARGRKPHLGIGRPDPALATGCEDFIGVNYYTRARIRFDVRKPWLLFGRHVSPLAPGNTLKMENYPEGLYSVLLRTAARKSANDGMESPPIIVTENGVADRNDELRPAYLVQHLAAVHRAIGAGARVAGYLHWSSMDNFEWTEGFEPRFGLIAVDYGTLERRPKPSAYLYADIIRRNALTPELLARYAVGA
jgi:beta-glucosidase